MNWAKDMKAELVKKKTMIKSWKRVDSTKFVHRPLGRLVKDFGGWKDPEAIQGACNGAMACMVLGEPYIMIHPQTKMVHYAIAELSWEESFTKSWDEVTDYYMRDEEKVEPEKEEDVAVEQNNKVAKIDDGGQKKQMKADLTENENKKEEDAREKAKEDEAKKKKKEDEDEEEKKGENSERSKMAKTLKESQ